MAPARPCGICTLILVTICKVYIYIYIYNTVLLLHFVIEGCTKEKLHTIQKDFKPPTPSLSQGCCQFWIFLKVSFLLVLIFINSQLTHLERYGLS